MSKEKQRLVILLENELFEKLKLIAEDQNRTPGNLGTTIVKEYLKNYDNKTK